MTTKSGAFSVDYDEKRGQAVWDWAQRKRAVSPAIGSVKHLGNVSRGTSRTPLENFYCQLAEGLCSGQISAVVFGEGDRQQDVGVLGWAEEKSDR